MKNTTDSSAIDQTLTALDDYVLLGKSGLRTFGEEWGYGSNMDISKKIFDTYYENGGNFFDTANVYTNGESERFLGQYIADKRSSCVIATKTPVQEVMRALDDVVRSGKALYVAVSDTPSWVVSSANTLADLRGLTPFIGFQTRYNLLNRSLESDIQPMCADHGLGIIPWSVLAEGFLSGKHSRDQKDSTSKRQDQVSPHMKNHKNWAILDEVRAIATECNRTPAQVAMNWTLQKPGITSPLLGVRTLEQLEGNLGALEFTLSPQQMARLDFVSNPKTWPFPQDVVRNLDKFTGVGIQIEMPQRYHAVQSLRTSKI
ncbi:hypothetical protein EMPS_05343 [Entomortierella parvispora]|uniref:NADP-dependent oxidoreductase domain-containing protein n=1 Tax=Entomortierella parvispora TaxID=205924 RepID=A0A9P3LWN4_9FUNG|nr:hypothetical protein EMPS_05343 [Entomortierella parvispora]